MLILYLIFIAGSSHQVVIFQNIKQYFTHLRDKMNNEQLLGERARGKDDMPRQRGMQCQGHRAWTYCSLPDSPLMSLLPSPDVRPSDALEAAMSSPSSLVWHTENKIGNDSDSETKSKSM